MTRMIRRWLHLDVSLGKLERSTTDTKGYRTIVDNTNVCNVHRKYISSFRESRMGTLGSSLDIVGDSFSELLWRCILRKQLQKILAVTLGCMSVAILLAEATLLPSGVDLSLFSILINAVGKQEVLVQVKTGKYNKGLGLNRGAKL
ncbi:hypothetical protein BHE74_00056529, partial [Ensete ventricosum]